MENTQKNTRAIWIKLALIVVALAVLFYVARAFGLAEYIAALQDFVKAQGALGKYGGPIIFIGLYILTTILALPGSALTIMAGALFGSVIGTGVVIIGATIGATACFLIARYFARESILKLLSGNEKFQKLENLTEKNGYIIVAITRLVPLFPFNVLNYGFGLTKVPLKEYVLWSALCMLPGTILYVVGADAVTTALRDGSIPWVLVFIVAMIVAILAVIVKKARARLVTSD